LIRVIRAIRGYELFCEGFHMVERGTMNERRPTFREAVRFWAKLGCISFGGPAGQIAVMHRELVEKKRWVEEERFLHALNFCMLLPGPEATQLATYCGWLLHGVRGGLTAGVLFVLPGALALWTLSWIYVCFGAAPAVTAVFHGLKAVVLAIVVAAVLRLGRKTLKNPVAWGLAVAAFAALAFLQAPFPVVVLGALTAGFLGGRIWPEAFGVKTGSATGELNASGVNGASGKTRPTVGGTARIAGIGVALWFAPVVVAGLTQGWGGLYAQLGWFFSKAAVVTFGGAYAVLPYVGQQAVENYHWLSAPQMIDGLAFAETTPGPLIMVLQFVGFLAGWQQPGTLAPLGAATWAAAITTWVTFVPTYLFILVGAPYVERLREHARLSAALAAVTASVVGVILNLAVWFAQHAVWPAGWGGGADWFVAALGVVSLAALHFGRIGLGWVVLAGGLAGWGWSLLG
jgi:chromate transporter